MILHECRFSVGLDSHMPPKGCLREAKQRGQRLDDNFLFNVWHLHLSFRATPLERNV